MSTQQYIFKYDYDDLNSYKITIVSNHLHKVLDLLQTHPKQHFYELIPGNVPVKEYYDIDLAYTGPDPQGKGDALIRDVLCARNTVLSEMVADEEDFTILTAHTPTKVSVHMVSTGVAYRTNDVQKYTVVDINQELKRMGSEARVDPSVYSRNQCFRLLGNSKRGKHNTLVFHPRTEHVPLEQTFVRIHEHDTTFEYVELYTVEDVAVDARRPATGDCTLTEDHPIVESFLRDHPEYVARNGDEGRVRLNRVARTQCLSTPEMHSKENAFLFKNEYGYWFHCFCSNHNRKIAEHEDRLARQCAVLVEPSRYTTHTLDGFLSKDAYRDLMEDTDILFDKRIMGQGKTYSSIGYTESRGPFLFLHHRISLDDDIRKQYGLESYQQRKTTADTSMTVCINSLFNTLTRKNMSIHDFPVIVVDEFRGVLRSTEMANMEHNTSTLFDILEGYRGKLILMDANLSDEDIEYVLAKRPGTRYKVLESVKDTTQFNLALESLEGSRSIQFSATMARLSKHDFTQSKVIICSTMGIHTKNHAIVALIEHEGLKALHINKDTRTGMDLSTEHLQQYDVIVVSPTISEGVSFDDPVFASYTCYGFFTNQSCPAETAVQMLRRWRAVKNFHVVLGIDPHTQRYKTEDEYHAYASAHLNQLHTYISKKRVYQPARRIHRLDIERDEFWELHCRNTLDTEYQKAFFEQAFIEKAKANLFHVQPVEGEVYADNERYNEINNAVNTDFYTHVSQARLLTKQEYEYLDATASTLETTLQSTKYKIHNAWNLSRCPEADVTVNVYRHWDNAAVRTQAYNIRRLVQFRRGAGASLEQVPVQEILDTMARDVWTRVHETFFKERLVLKVAEYTVFWGWLSALGFRNLPDTGGVDEPAFQRKLHQLQRRIATTPRQTGRLNMLFKQTMGTPIEIGKLLNKYLAITWLTLDGKVYLNIGALGLVFTSDTQPNLVGQGMFDEGDDEFIETYQSFLIDPNAKTKHCTVCNKYMGLRHYYKTHIHSKGHLTKVDKPPRERTRYECGDCEDTFTNKRIYERHKRTHQQQVLVVH